MILTNIIKRNYFLIVLISFILIFVSCTKLSDPTKSVDESRIIKISYTSNDSTLLADASDNIEILASLNDSFVGANRTVTFTTEQGSFIGAGTNPMTINVIANGYVAKAILRSDDIVNNNVHLTVSIGDYRLYPSVIFTRSYPDEISVQPSKFILKADLSDHISWAVDLKKSSGKVSKGTKVDFELQKIKDNPSLFIAPIYWNETSSNSTELKTTTQDTGMVKVRAKVFDGVNYIYSKDTFNIYIK